jgi:hypothetical protein
VQGCVDMSLAVVSWCCGMGSGCTLHGFLENITYDYA